MNKNTIKGTIKEVAGSVESAYGDLTGNNKAKFKGEVKKTVGTAQKEFGKATDAE